MHCDNRLLSTLPRIMYPTRGLSTLRLNVILSEMCLPRRWLLSDSHLLRSS